MMLHSLAARALLMMADFGCSSTEAVLWVCHRLPVTLHDYYCRAVITTLASELSLEVAQ